MAHNTQVSADHNAPAITRILADFVATHPSRGWDDSVESEAKRTILAALDGSLETGSSALPQKHAAAGSWW